LGRSAPRIAPGAYRWRARVSAKGQSSAWSLPREFQVADPATVQRFKETGQFLGNGKNWRTWASSGDDQGKVTSQNNLKQGDKTIPLAFAVERGKVARDVKFLCKLDQPLPVQQGYQYSLRVIVQGDTAAGAEPTVTIGLRYGYALTKDYDPIDRGWTIQHALSQDTPTQVRTTIRLPVDQHIEDVSINLSTCRGGVKVLNIDLIPETEYETGTDRMCEFDALVREYDGRKGVGTL
jgi:hypothetical protein